MPTRARLRASLFLLLSVALVRPDTAADAAGRIPAFGLTLALEGDAAMVVEVEDGGPAHRGGLRPGDQILKIGGVPLQGSSLVQILARFETPSSGPLAVDVRRRGGGRQELQLKRAATAGLGTAAPAPTLDAEPRSTLPGPQSTGRPDVIGRAALAVGDAMIDFTLPRLGGGEVTLSQFKGKPILLDFWATWCTPCRAEAPALAAIHQRYGEAVQIIGVSLDYAPGQAISYTLETGLTYPQALSAGWQDPVVQQYGIHRTGIPFNVLFDTEGRVAALDLHGEPLVRALEILLDRD